MKQITIPGKWVDKLIAAKRVVVTIFRYALLKLGLNVIRSNDYYSPLPNALDLKKNQARWDRSSQLSGIQYDLDAFKTTLKNLLEEYLDEFNQYPSYENIAHQRFGPGYTAVDAITLYMMIRSLKPKKYIEIGSGISTFYCSMAAYKNSLEGHPLQIYCIEPFPYNELEKINGINIRVSEVQNIELSYFAQLQENDILFIDSSHALKIDSDVQYLYLEVLPNLNPGVVIHIHDVPLPYNIPYPSDYWIFHKAWPKFWNEAMLVQAFLCYNSKFKILLSTPLLRYHDEAFLQENIPFYKTIKQHPNTFSSLWIQRVT